MTTTTARRTGTPASASVSARPRDVSGPRGAARPFPSALFFMTLLAITSRGLFELVLGKTVGYAIQAGAVALFAAVLVVRHRARPTPHFATMLGLWWLLVVASLLSVWASAQPGRVAGAAIYAVVMVFLAGLMVLLGGLTYEFGPGRGPGPALVTCAAIMVVVALMQQFGGLTVFPGTDFGTLRTQARPPAMTGSFLHYPIALGLMSFVLLGIHAVQRRRLYLVAAVVSMVAVLVSYSRSGMVLVLAGLAIGVLLSRSFSLVARALVAGGALAVAFLVAAPTDTYLQRFLSIFSPDGAGNAGRIDAWQTLLDLWSRSPLLIGSHAGEYTNITSNLAPGGAVASPESGVLQVLVSLGLLGALAYYGLMAVTTWATPGEVPWFRAGLLAAIVQSLIYQSVEVLPFMALFALTPLLARTARTPPTESVQDPQRLADVSDRPSTRKGHP
ncbi:O-antigen ligase family protein [Cellulomonas sp. FA1]|uniref:O-antigen ligase family protein n=1 Tax=Cellulomonas sp. FA1 TaxID=1346710 RepID=UPI000A6F1F8F|nr:O-antigen ligase family protein [Cellulomonas sp. FA1]